MMKCLPRLRQTRPWGIDLYHSRSGRVSWELGSLMSCDVEAWAAWEGREPYD